MFGILAESFEDVLSQVFDHVKVILHGKREVHQVVEVNRVAFSSLE